MKSDLNLIFVNPIGVDWEGIKKYQLIFSKNHTDIEEGDDWDMHPASSGRIGIPPNCDDKDLVLEMMINENELELNCIQKSNSFSFYDAMEGIVALMWEDLSNYDYYPNDRIFFRFGDNLNEVKKKLFNRDIKYNVIFEKDGGQNNNKG